MKIKLSLTLVLLLLLLFNSGFSQQIEDIELDPVKVEKFIIYVKHKHGGDAGFETWKANNKMQYAKEMWYYTESYYVKRNHFNEGITLNEEIIDIARFEHLRKQNEEAPLIIDGFKDIIMLLPESKLIYKP